MGCLEQAVLEFDEEVRAPWRPLLVVVSDDAGPAPSLPARHQPSRRNPSRVGACRPSAAIGGGTARSVRAAPRAAGPTDRPTGPDARSGRPEHGRRDVIGRPRSTRVRLTRRARRLAVVLALCGGVVVGSLVSSLVSGDGGEGIHLAGVSSVVVEPGDTLWSIASSVADGEDVRVVVDRIQELNRLEGSGLVPGQVLQLP